MNGDTISYNYNSGGKFKESWWGDNPADCCTWTLRHIITDQLAIATNFNWKGTGEKRSFTKLKMKNVIINKLCYVINVLI